MTENVDAGNVVCNDVLMNMAVEDIPFGGVGESGMGNYHGIHGFNTFSRAVGSLIRSQNSEFLTFPRYQYFSYDVKSIKFKLVKFLFEHTMPSWFYLKICSIGQRNPRFFNFVGFSLIVFASGLIGASIQAKKTNSPLF
jgi:hypothetical protein